MISRLRDWLATVPAKDGDAKKVHTVELSVAVLLVELARADHDLSSAEDREMQKLLAERLDLGASETRALLDDAKHIVTHSVSLHEFTRTVHERMDYDQKQMVIEMLWQIALVDRDLDKYEDYVIGKVAELLYVSRRDVIRLKHRVLEALS